MKILPKRIALDLKIVNHAYLDCIYHKLTDQFCIKNFKRETYLIVHDLV